MKRYLTTKEAAEYIGISYQNFRCRRSKGEPMPVCIKFGDNIRYMVEDLDNFMYSNRQTEPETQKKDS